MDPESLIGILQLYEKLQGLLWGKLWENSDTQSPVSRTTSRKTQLEGQVLLQCSNCKVL